jgi:lipopolysaccharide transport system permease protein
MIRVLHVGANARAFIELLALMHRFRGLIAEMVKRDVSEQYAGQVFGALWAIGHPLFMAALYVFIFAYVFQMRIGGTLDLPRDYTTYLLAGLMPWLGFQAGMTRAAISLTGQANLVKQVVFPIEVLPIKAVASALIPQLVGLVFLTGYQILKFAALPWTYALLPVLLLLQVLAMLGIAFLLASIGVFFRDLKDFVQLFATAGVFILPVFYLPQWVPQLFKPLLYVNPFSYPVWCYQDALYFGRIEHPWAWAALALGAPLLFVTGYRVFRRLKPHVGDVL